MHRVVSLYLPTWPTDRVRRRLGASAPPPEDPLVLIGRGRVVTAVDAAARRLRLRPGMTATQAQALVQGLHTAEADPAEDKAALQRLALWAHKLYAPIVAADPPDGLRIDATGAAHLHGGEAPMLADLVGRLAGGGIRARAALAGTYGAAHALARYRARPVWINPRETPVAAVADLPVAALRLSDELVGNLRSLGFDRIGELEAQPRAPLALRFGPDPGRRLDQLFGRLTEPLVSIVPPDPIEVRRAFAEPIGAPEILARYTALLVADLCGLLEARGLGARRLDLLFHRVDARAEAIRAGTARPVRDPKRLSRLLCERLETMDPGFGVESMVLTAPVAEALVYRPAATTLADPPEPDVSSLIDTLLNRIGPGRLYRQAVAESDIPERSVTRIPPLAGPTTGRWPAQWPRPARLLAPPEPIETLALLPDHPPAQFTWRGGRRRVRRADGPERIHGEWWRYDAETAAVRDYFQVEDETGARFWLFRAGDGQDPATGPQTWFLHGVFG